MSLRQEGTRIVTNPALAVGVILVAGLIAIGALGPALAPYDPNVGVNIVWEDVPGGAQVPAVPPTLPDAHHVLGTDPLGRDQWSRILAGAWLTLAVVLASTIFRFGIGVTLGVASGWYGGALARLLGVIARGVASLPQLLLAILLVLVMRPLGAIGFIAALALVGWPEIAEFVASASRRAKAEPFIEAARSLGVSERRLVTTHLLSTLAPRLLTLGALEMGAVLLLLAELGVVGLFVAGATFLVGDFGPIGPLKGRVPEWGQMLGAIQFYAISEQLSTVLPAVFIVLAATAFTLLADGLRSASDPFGAYRLRPTTFSVLAKVLAGALCFSALGFIGVDVRPGILTMEDGRAISATVANASWPGSVLVAAVARYVSPTDFAHPQRLTYYYRNSQNEVLRITFVNAQRLATEVRPYETEDEIEFAPLRALPEGLSSYQAPATFSNDQGGGELRANLGASLVRAILTWPPERATPAYIVTIGQPRLLTLSRFCCFNALTGVVEPGASWHGP